MEITRKSVLTDALQREERTLADYSINQTKLIPRPKFEQAFRDQQEKCRILREMIHALDSETVRRAMADWQKNVIQNGPPERLVF